MNRAFVAGAGQASPIWFKGERKDASWVSTAAQLFDEFGGMAVKNANERAFRARGGNTAAIGSDAKCSERTLMCYDDGRSRKGRLGLPVPLIWVSGQRRKLNDSEMAWLSGRKDQ